VFLWATAYSVSPREENTMPERIKVWIQKRNDRAMLALEWADPETGLRKSRSAKTADPEEAERRRADLEYELNHGLAKEPSRMPWETFCDYYRDEKLAGNREATRKKADYVLDSFQELARPKTLGTVTERTLSRYASALRELGRSPATIQAHLAYLRAALRWAADQRFIPVAPKVVMPKVPKKRNIRKISSEELERLMMKAPDEPWRAFIATAWYTGMRRNEMLDMTWDKLDAPHVDRKENRVWIPAAYNKSDEDQWVPLHPQLRESLE